MLDYGNTNHIQYLRLSGGLKVCCIRKFEESYWSELRGYWLYLIRYRPLPTSVGRILVYVCLKDLVMVKQQVILQLQLWLSLKKPGFHTHPLLQSYNSMQKYVCYQLETFNTCFMELWKGRVKFSHTKSLQCGKLQLFEVMNWMCVYRSLWWKTQSLHAACDISKCMGI